MATEVIGEWLVLQPVSVQTCLFTIYGKFEYDKRGKTNLAMENGPGLNMYFLLSMWKNPAIAMLVKSRFR